MIDRRFAWVGAALVLAAGVVAGCTSTMTASGPSHDEVVATLKSSFKAKGQAGLDRLDQDETQRVCSDYFNKPLPPEVAQKIEAANMATIRWPADGRYMGDWKAGEKIAQEGRGMQSSDEPGGPVGGNCYACHQLSPAEISYGTM